MDSTHFLDGEVEVTSDKVRVIQTEGTFAKKSKIFSVTLSSFDSVGAETEASPLYLIFFGLFLIIGLYVFTIVDDNLGYFIIFLSIICLIAYFVIRESTVFFNTKGGNQFKITVKGVGIENVTAMCDEIEAQIKIFKK